MPIDEKTIAAVKAEHGTDRELYLLTEAEEGEQVVVRMPSRAEMRRLSAADEKKTFQGLEGTVLSCLLYPDKAAYNAMCERRPGLPAAFGNEILRLTGAAAEVEAKKL